MTRLSHIEGLLRDGRVKTEASNATLPNLSSSAVIELAFAKMPLASVSIPMRSSDRLLRLVANGPTPREQTRGAAEKGLLWRNGS